MALKPAYKEAIEVAIVDSKVEGRCTACAAAGKVLRVAAGRYTRLVIHFCPTCAQELRSQVSRLVGQLVPARASGEPQRFSSERDRHLLEALDVDAIGPSGLAQRFTVRKLRIFIRERGHVPRGKKSDLALQLSRLLKEGEK